jgi:RecA-family ATPase
MAGHNGKANHVDDAVAEAELSLLSAAVRESDRDASAAIASLPADVWTCDERRNLAQVVAEMHEAGERVTTSAILITGRVSASYLCTVTETYATLQPDKRADFLRQESLRRRFVEKARQLGRIAHTLDANEIAPVVSDWFDITPDAREFLPIADLSNWGEIARLNIPSVFRGSVYRGTLSLLAAEGGVGKSYLSLEMALSVALGMKILNAFEPIQPGRVLCLYGEDPREVVAQRLDAIRETHGLRHEQIDAAVRNHRLECVCGGVEPLLHFDAHGHAEESKAYRELRRRCAMQRYDLVIIDPLIAWGGLVNENDNAAMDKVADCLKRLAVACVGGVLGIHHASKSGSAQLNQASARGGSALACACRWVANMRLLSLPDAQKFGLDDSEASSYVEVSETKNSYAPRLGMPRILKRSESGALMDCGLRSLRIGRIAEAIASALDQVFVGVTERELISQPKGKPVRQVVEDIVGGRVTRVEYVKALAYAMDPERGFSLLRLVDVGSPKDHRKELAPCTQEH